MIYENYGITVAKTREYHPKGGMCATCQSAKQDCSKLRFHTMPRISEAGDVVTVRCTQFKRAIWVI